MYVRCSSVRLYLWACVCFQRREEREERSSSISHCHYVVCCECASERANLGGIFFTYVCVRKHKQHYCRARDTYTNAFSMSKCVSESTLYAQPKPNIFGRAFTHTSPEYIYEWAPQNVWTASTTICLMLKRVCICDINAVHTFAYTHIYERTAKPYARMWTIHGAVSICSLFYMHHNKMRCCYFFLLSTPNTHTTSRQVQTNRRTTNLCGMSSVSYKDDIKLF